MSLPIQKRPGWATEVAFGPSSWQIDVEVHATPKSMAVATVAMRIPRTVRTNYRYVITLDAARDEGRLGEVTEMLVNIAPLKAH